MTIFNTCEYAYAVVGPKALSPAYADRTYLGLGIREENDSVLLAALTLELPRRESAAGVELPKD